MQPKDVELESSRQTVKEVKNGSLCFVILIHLVAEEGEKNTKIPFVKDFVDVFPDEVPGLPPKREVKFSIDLVSGVGLVSIVPYHMAPTELVELKKQIDELL